MCNYRGKFYIFHNLNNVDSHYLAQSHYLCNLIKHSPSPALQGHFWRGFLFTELFSVIVIIIIMIKSFMSKLN